MTREQLERLAEKINGKWPCQHKTQDDMIWLWDGPWEGDGIDFCAHLSDIENSPFIVFCLDRLEEMGMDLVILSAYKGKYCTWDSWSEDAESLNNVAPTRAEALALALLAKLEEE